MALRLILEGNYDHKKENTLEPDGLLSHLSLASYTAMVVFATLAYPGYDWKS